MTDKTDVKERPTRCKECDAEKGYHTLNCTVGGFGGFHPCM